ncbi:MAG: NAD(P)/FAD-dependent oxidoreductase [Bacteroidota bacterium]
MYDVIVIGGGPAGMTAGVFASRKGLKTAIISKEFGGQANWTTDIENYMGFTEIDGQALMDRFEAQVREHRLDQKQTDARMIRQEEGIFRVFTVDQGDYTAGAVIVATGKRPKTLNVPGEAEFRNKGVSYCSTCDGPLFRGVPVVVVGGGNSALKAVFDLNNYASEIHLISLTELTADAVFIERFKSVPKLKQYIGHMVVEIKGSKLVERVMVENQATKERFEIPVQGVFIEIGLDPNTEFLEGLVEKTNNGEIKIDCECKTNVPGLFAAGDATTVPEKQIIIAAGEGAKAAINAWEYLLQHEPARTMAKV